MQQLYALPLWQNVGPAKPSSMVPSNKMRKAAKLKTVRTVHCTTFLLSFASAAVVLANLWGSLSLRSCSTSTSVGTFSGKKLVFMPPKAAEAISDEISLFRSPIPAANKTPMSAGANEFPLLTLVIPSHDASKYIPQLMDTLWNQTYPNLEIIFSLEPSYDADVTEAMLSQHQHQVGTSKRSAGPIQRIQIYRQKYRLYYTEHMNFLLSKVQSKYYSYMQCDDTLPSNYYEKLVMCLKENPQAVNCYPGILYQVPGDEYLRKIQPKITKLAPQPSVVGPHHVRVEKLVRGEYFFPNRGVVRRPEQGRPFFYPRLHKAYTSADKVLMVKHAIEGEMISVDDVEYYKLAHMKSIANAQYRNESVFSTDDFLLGLVDSFARRYNLAHSYVASSDRLAKWMIENLATARVPAFLKTYRNMKNEEERIRIGRRVADQFWGRIRDNSKRVAILGAGIQGCLMALMFRKHGYDVTVIDKSHDIMSRASFTGEGRIHLGLEYANDASMQTAGFMLESAMRFSHYVEYLVEKKLDWSQLKSERLTCLLPHTSHVTPRQFESYGQELDQMYEGILLENPELSYLGERPPRILLGRTKVPSAVNASYINAAYDSIEVCVLSNKLRDILREALSEQDVHLVFNRTILDVKRKKQGAKQTGQTVGQLRVVSDIGEHDYDAVVNCLWEGRAAIDRKIGLNNRVKNESYRVKANVRLPNLLKLHADIPSVSVMNGPFGDFVRYGPDDAVYFAWHPMSPSVIMHNVSDLQRQFERHAVSDFPPGYKKHMIDGHRKAFEALFPGYDSSFFDQGLVGTGYVVANGLTDIDDKDSGLHVRKDPPNLIADGYISVKTQKLTNAPYNAYLLEKELFYKNSLLANN